jgi:hypothetical protein
MMSVAHLASRLMIKTPIDKSIKNPIAVHDELSVESYRKRVATAQTQDGIKLKLTTPQRKSLNAKIHYFRSREKRLAQIKNYIMQNRESRNAWARGYRKKNADKYNSYSYAWRERNPERVREYERRCREKKRNSMTHQERSEMNKLNYQKTRAAMVARYGLQGWREICTARSQKSREKKRGLDVN